MTEKTIDQRIDEVRKIVENQKKVVLDTESKSSRPWTTTGVLNLPNLKLNLLTAKESAIVSALADILSLKDYHSKAATMLNSKEKFSIDGYTLDDWKNDFESRINKIKLKNEKEKLEKLELRLKNIMSEDLKREIELDQIMKELEE